MYDARQIANWFIRRASQEGRSLSIMSLLKLIYIAHGWHLEMRNSPLFYNKIEAWKYGPVVPDVYNAFRTQGVEVRTELPIGGSISTADSHLLEQIYQIYGRLSAVRLSELTHEPDGPWDQATRLWGYFAPIPDTLIRPHYQMKRKQAQVHHGV